MSQQDAGAAELDEFHFFLLAGFEADGSACGDVEPHAARRFAIEFERVVHFEEMVMTADLYGAVAGMPHDHAGHFSAGVRNNGIRLQEPLTWFHFDRLTESGRVRSRAWCRRG